MFLKYIVMKSEVLAWEGMDTFPSILQEKQAVERCTAVAS